MKMAERIQAAIHSLEVGGGARAIRITAVVLAFIGLAVVYDTRAYHSFNSPEAMDAAQVARNVAEGHGFTTDFVRPLSLFLVQKQNRERHSDLILSTNAFDFAQINGNHPDLANPPVYPAVLAGWFKVWTPQWKVELHQPFWSEGGSFRRYEPEFRIAILNQLLLALVVILTFFVAKKLLGVSAAWLAALLTLGLDLLWKFSVSGLSTLLLMALFLALAWCLLRVDEIGRAEIPDVRRLFLLALAAGGLTGLGMLTRYSFGWLILPVAVYFVSFGGARRLGLAVAAFLTFGVVVSPWLIRNLSLSNTLFGTASYVAMEDGSIFPNTQLMQSLAPNWGSAYGLAPYLHKLLANLQQIAHGELFQLGGGWMGVLFLTSLLAGLHHVAAKRLRYFILMCLGVFILVEAMGRTQLSQMAWEFNSENLLALLAPFVVIFGVAFFQMLLNQLDVAALEARLAAVATLAILVWQPLVSTLIIKSQTLSYPPYYPPDVQKIADWMRPDELIMSDIPWAVAWYGDRQCVWTTINSQYEFSQLNDYIKPVNALYLSLNTLDGKLFSECLQGGDSSWGNFTLKTVIAHQLPEGFPLKNFPQETLISGICLTDRIRW